MSNLTDHFNEIDEKAARDAKLFEEHDRDLCMLCHAYGADKRSLFIRCGYRIDEIVPEFLDLHKTVSSKLHYYINICKSCRGALLDMLVDWREERVALRSVAKDHDGELEWQPADANVPMRVNGRTVMMTMEQAKEFRAKLDELLDVNKTNSDYSK